MQNPERELPVITGIEFDLRKNRIKVLMADAAVSAKELANLIDMQPHTLRRYVRHEAEPRLEIAQSIADALNVTVDQVLGVDSEGSVVSKSTPQQRIPIYGAAEGGVGVDISDVNEPIDSITAPDFLSGSPTAYAVYVVGDSMAPRIQAGEIAFVHPGLPYKAGDLVVVQFENDGNKTAIVKEFVALSDEAVSLSQYSPEQNLSFPREGLLSIHKIVGVKF